MSQSGCHITHEDYKTQVTEHVQDYCSRRIPIDFAAAHAGQAYVGDTDLWMTQDGQTQLRCQYRSSVEGPYRGNGLATTHTLPSTTMTSGCAIRGMSKYDDGQNGGHAGGEQGDAVKGVAGYGKKIEMDSRLFDAQGNLKRGSTKKYREYRREDLNRAIQQETDLENASGGVEKTCNFRSWNCNWDDPTCKGKCPPKTYWGAMPGMPPGIGVSSRGT